MSKFLPVGIQDFEKMILGNFVYVDKTQYLYDMAFPLQALYFLARPRRFGKSLLVSSFEHLFKGHRELFRGLRIEQSDWQWKPHPVIKVDFSSISYETPKTLEKDLTLLMRQLAEKHGIKSEQGSLPRHFSELITGLAKKYNEQVVVLIDEYDKPIIEHLGKGKSALSVAKENRDVLKSFFGVMKGGDVSASLRFVFITGISKFARVSIFSDLNNLNDISMNRKYATLLGYTEEELVSFFSECISQLAHETETHSAELVRKIRRWYDGYRFTALEKRVYNPFSVVRLFDAGEFENFWFETATPSFLVNLIKEKKYPVLEIESLKLPRELFSIYDPETLQIEPLLFQTGYITIRKYENELWHMEYPNQEVRVSFLSYLLNDFARVENVRLLGAYKLLGMYLREKRTDEFIQTVQAILASVPYVHIANQDEAYYHTVFYLMLAASGVDVRTEVLTSQGRIDLTLESDEMAVIAELKCNSSSKKAIQQILEKKYYEKYLNDQREIYLLGINFNTEKRTIDDWQWGELKKFLKVPSDQKQKGKRKKSGKA
ncbi:MAG: ATP-binding protein [Desulfobacterales bacterium]|nr:ATP-binding protein [Desulfobacterales bacterium]